MEPKGPDSHQTTSKELLSGIQAKSTGFRKGGKICPIDGGAEKLGKKDCHRMRSREMN
jgi:hypothetical protein